MKRILVVGGGSGGHVTPVVSVLRVLDKKHKSIEVRFWSDKRFLPNAKKIVHEYNKNIVIKSVFAGKFRRYRNLSKLQHILTPSVFFPNFRDTFLALVGLLQSILRLLFWRPDVVFAKGGYVCLPVGIAAWMLRIPLVIHDSDATPGLTNRILAPFASRIATGMPLEHYNYPLSKSVYVGIPIDPVYQPISKENQNRLKIQLGFNVNRPLTVISGGGLGAQSINNAVATQLSSLLELTNVLLISGTAHYDVLRSLTPFDDERFRLVDFLPGLADAFGAADVVVTRAGATTLLELASLGKPTILIPNKHLKWQIEHAKLFIEANAVLNLDEGLFLTRGDKSIIKAINHILSDSTYRNLLSKNLHNFAKPKAAEDVVHLLEEVTGK